MTTHDKHRTHEDDIIDAHDLPETPVEIPIDFRDLHRAAKEHRKASFIWAVADVFTKSLSAVAFVCLGLIFGYLSGFSDAREFANIDWPTIEKSINELDFQLKKGTTE